MRRPSWPDLAAASIIVLALVLRLREPLSSPIIGAEDPYLRMTDVWNLVQHGELSEHYPPGFSILLAPFAWMGPAALYGAARFGPPFLGAAGVLGIYLVGRGRLRPVGALAAALVVAAMPENIFRTNLLFPTALDLALLPFLFLSVLRGTEGHPRAWWGAAALLALMLVTHPWVVALVVPTLAIFALALASRDSRRRVMPIAGAAGVGGIALAIALSKLPGTWNPAPAFLQNAWPKLVTLVLDPRAHELPVHVNLPMMLTLPVLVAASVGAATALWSRSRLALLAVAWSAFILPFVLVDWFDIWFIPHRSVAYLSVGVALLAGLAFDAAARAAPPMPRAARVLGATASLALALALVLPSALALGPWYRLYDEGDYEAWHEIASREPAQVITGSWQTAKGYRAITGENAAYNPTFFEDRDVRSAMLAERPDTVVIVDEYSRKNGHARDDLPDWRKVGEWDGGRIKAYAPA